MDRLRENSQGSTYVINDLMLLWQTRFFSFRNGTDISAGGTIRFSILEEANLFPLPYNIRAKYLVVITPVGQI